MAARSEPAVFHPTEGDVTLPGATGISEFFGFASDCGQAAAEVIYSWASGKPASGAHINAVVSAMQQAGLAGSGGLSTLQGNSQALTAQGIPNTVTSDWKTAISQFAGIKPVEIGVSQAHNLPGDELTVNNHFLTIVGRTAQGNLVASDPDNAAAKAGQLNVYTPAQIAAAAPWGAIVPSGQGATDPATQFWQGLQSGLGFGLTAPAVASSSNSHVSPQDQLAIQAGQTLGAFQYNLPSYLWKGGLIVFGALLVLAGVIIFILPNRRDMNTAAGIAAEAA